MQVTIQNMRIISVKYFAVRALYLLLIVFPLVAKVDDTPTSNYSVLVSPHSVVRGQTFQVLIASERPLPQASLKACGPSGPLVVLKQSQGGGPPYWWTATYVAKKAGIHRVWLEQDTSLVIETHFTVSLSG
ncbi:hypothetical protein ACFLT2_06570 [Acidobacteriota bacterium]